MEIDFLQKVIFNSSDILCKIGLTNHIKALQNGIVYMKNLKFHKEQERKHPNLNIGDELEGVLLKNSKGYLVLNETEKIPVLLNNLELDEKYPIFCAMKINLINGQRFLPNKKLKSDFALNNIEEYSVLIFEKENFINKCNITLTNKGLDGVYSAIKYTDEFLMCNNLYELAYKKRTRYKYQNEHRLLVNYKVDDFFTIDIGSIKDKSFLTPAKDFFDNGILFT